MKKVVFVLVLILVIVPATVFAEMGFGLSAFYNTPLEAGDLPESESLHAENFTFGPDARLKIAIFQGEALALITLDPFIADIFLNAGIALDIAILRLSAGIGPKLTYGGDDEVVRGGYNLKLNADVVLGSLSLGVSYLFNTTLGSDFDVRGRSGLFGVSLMFW